MKHFLHASYSQQEMTVQLPDSAFLIKRWHHGHGMLSHQFHRQLQHVHQIVILLQRRQNLYMIIPKTSYGIQSTTHREKILLKGENLTSCRVDRQFRMLWSSSSCTPGPFINSCLRYISINDRSFTISSQFGLGPSKQITRHIINKIHIQPFSA